MAKNIYMFNCDSYYGSLCGLFLAEEKDIKELIGNEIYFGDVLGKHSNVSFELDESNITLITADQEFIKKAQQYKLIPMGYNPFDYFENE